MSRDTDQKGRLAQFSKPGTRARFTVRRQAGLSLLRALGTVEGGEAPCPAQRVMGAEQGFQTNTLLLCWMVRKKAGVKVSSSHQVAKGLEFRLQHQSFQ